MTVNNNQPQSQHSQIDQDANKNMSDSRAAGEASQQLSMQKVFTFNLQAPIKEMRMNENSKNQSNPAAYANDKSASNVTSSENEDDDENSNNAINSRRRGRGDQDDDDAITGNQKMSKKDTKMLSYSPLGRIMKKIGLKFGP